MLCYARGPLYRRPNQRPPESPMFLIIDVPKVPVAQAVASEPQPLEASSTEAELHPLLEEPKLYETGAEQLNDESDVASRNELQANADAVKRAVERAKIPPPPEDFDGKTCVKCGEDIPAGRLVLGYFICVACQSAKELADKLRR